MIDVLSVMPTYNCAEIVGLGIRCALEQDIEHHLVVIDDSTDGTTDVIRDLLRDADATLITVDHWRPLARKEDMGVMAYACHFVAQWDCDNYCPPDRLRTQRNSLNEHNALAVSHIPYTRWARPMREDNIWALRYNGHPLQMNVGGTFFYPRALWEAVGGHDTDRHPGEDMDFGHKCKAVGAESLPAPAAFSEHFLGFEWGGNVFKDRLHEPTFYRTDERWQEAVPAWVQGYFDDSQ